jgi:MATE family multidrug resistance protein
MYQTNTRKDKLKLFALILWPILVTQIGLYSMNFFDTMMSGRFNKEDLAGVAIGSSIWVPVFTGLSGILLSITPIVAQLIGSKKKQNVSFQVIQGIYLGIVISLVIILFGKLFLNQILDSMNLEASVRTIAKGYLVALSFGIVPLFIYTVLRCFVDALGETKISMIITLSSLPINVFFNYILIFGKFGMPELGGVGAGYASAITYWCILIISIITIIKVKPFSLYKIFSGFYTISYQAWKEQLTIGVPIGFAIFFETSIFAAVTLLMSNFDTITIASHQAAINFASLLYMIPLSISMALTIVVGFEVGAKRYSDAKSYSYLGIGIGIMFAIVCSIFLWNFRGEVARLYSNEPKVILLTIDFLLYAIFFQLSDAIAAPIQGALRGYKDVNITLLMAFISYWVVGLPVGYLLANFTEFQAFGYWIGLISGLAMGAITLFIRLIKLQKQKQVITHLENCGANRP